MCSVYANTNSYSPSSVSSHSSWTTVTSKTFSLNVSKTTTSKTIYLLTGLEYTNSTTGYVGWGNYKAVTIPALPSYAITYNANGGSGTPASQTKYYGTNITLSSTKPTRTNYVFKNWNTASGGTGTTYNPGASYTANAALTLYAQWYAPYTVTFNANGGTGGPSTQTKIYNTNLTLTTSQPTRSGYAFVKWNTKSDGTGTSYNSGATYSSNANVTLYAIWAAVPSIGTLTAVRCDENGDQDDEGAYATVACTWSCVGSSAITGTITPQSGGSATSFTFGTNPSGSGTVTSIALVGSGNGMVLDTDMQYTVSVTVTCITGGTTKTATRNVILTRAFFVMDWKAGGGAVGIGRAAPESGLEVGYPAVFDDNVTTYGTAHIKDHALQLDYQDLDTSYNATLSAQKDANIFVMDKNNLALAAFRGRQLASGEKRAVMEAHGYNSNGDSIWCNIICQVDKSGARSYSVSDAAAFRNAIAAVNKAGDTMTGALSIKDDELDRNGSNPSATVWGTGVQLLDKDGERVSQFIAARETDGRIRAGIWAYNEKTDGTQVNNSINAFIDRNGASTYSVSAPAAFRNALGASSGVFPASVGGTGSAYFDTHSVSDVNGSNVSLATGVTGVLGSFNLPAGKWIVVAGFNFASNATGRRIASLTNDGSAGYGARCRSASVQAVNGNATYINIVWITTTTGSSTTIKACGYQNSGAALNATVYMYVFRLK